MVEAAGGIPAGHKIARHGLAKDAPVRRYGQVIGFASAAIAAGDQVHTHNLELRQFDRTKAVGSAYRATQLVAEPASFEGYLRPGGQVGTRNYLGIIASVNCSATICKAIAERFRGEELPGIDGVVPITHSQGCGIDTGGEGMAVLQRTLGGMVRHPNFGAVLVVGLGCEANHIAGMFGAEGLETGPLLRTMTIQDEGGTIATIRRGEALVRELAALAGDNRRSTVSAAHITLGLQCGGSDGYSGITANPALGVAVDLLVANGGTAILSETPEIYGAEHLLTARAASPEVTEKLAARLVWWEDYTARNGGEMDTIPRREARPGG